MRTVGLDFGTTNSILSFYNEQTKSVDSWKMGGVDGENYIPSFVSIDEDNEVEIGSSAKENVLYREKIKSYSKFKILLSEDKEQCMKNGFKNVSPQEITEIYLKKLLDTYKQEQNILTIDKINVSIPEIWLKDNISARSELENILKNIGLKNIELRSEPVSAGAYFLHKYKINHNTDFNGHFLVFDFGGGTLDITLLKSLKNKITVLERTGKGRDSNLAGKAGVAYDQNVVKRAIKEQYNQTLKVDDSILLSLYVEFEKRKIQSSEKIKRTIEKFYKTKRNTPIFVVEKKNYELKITPSLLIEEFDKLFKEDIDNSLDEITSKFSYYDIDAKNDQKFKIVLVGGFSNFYLSQKAVMNFFNTQTLSDKRFEQDFTKEDSTLSISKGAALFAKDIIIEEQTYPMSIGIILSTLDSNGRQIEKIKTVYKRGENRKNSTQVRYLEENITRPGIPILFFDDGKISSSLTLPKSAKELFPNQEDKSNMWNIGFSIDKNSFYFLHIKDRFGTTKKIEFSYLVKKYQNALFIKEPTKEDDLSELIEKINRKLQEIMDKAANNEEIEDPINTFSNSLDPILDIIIRRIAFQNKIELSSQRELHKHINLLSSKISSENIKKLHKIRTFRNDHSHQTPKQLEDLTETKINKLINAMKSIIRTIISIQKEFKI